MPTSRTSRSPTLIQGVQSPYTTSSPTPLASRSSLFGRLYNSLVALSMLIFVAQLGYYNLLGFQF